MTQEFQPMEDESTPLLVTGEVVNSDPRKHNVIQSTSNALLQAKASLNQLARTDPETRRMATALISEKLETEYLKSMDVNNALRIVALQKLIAQSNEGLSTFYDKPTTILGIYQEYSSTDPDKYPPQESPKFFQAMLNLHRDLASDLLAHAEVTSEMGDIKAQILLADVRSELDIVKLQKKVNLAKEMLQHGNVIKAAAELESEVTSARWKGAIVPRLTAISGTPLYLIEGVAVAYDKWFERSKDKGLPTSAVIGGIYGFLTLLPSGPIAIAGGLVGALGGAASWKALSMAGEKIGEMIRDAKISRAENKKAKNEAKNHKGQRNRTKQEPDQGFDESDD